MAFRVCLIVCLVAPPIAWDGASVTGSAASCSVVGAPTASAEAKAHKTFSTAWLATAEIVVLRLPTLAANDESRQVNTASMLMLDAPPLAPRPPPQAEPVLSL